MDNKNDLHYFFFVLTIPCIFLLHNINQTFGLIGAFALFRLSLYYLLLSVVAGGLCLILFRQKHKAFLFCFLLLTFLFLFGVFRDAVRNFSLLQNLSRYVFFIPLSIAILVFTGIFIKRSVGLTKVSRFLAIYLLVNLFVECTWLAFNIFSGAAVRQDLGDAEHSTIKNLSIGNNLQRPVVFWFVFDEYAGSQSLKRMYGFKNPLDSMLKARKFYVPHRAVSNYNFTHYSVTSTLDMNYLDARLKNHSIVTLKDLVRGEASIYDNNVVRVFEKAGYIINNYTIFPMQGYAWKGIDWFKGTPESLVDFQTLSGRVQKEIGWNFTHFFSKNKLKKDSIDGATHLRNLDSVFKQLMLRTNLAAKSAAASEEPQVYLFHYMLPHEPYFYKANGLIAYENGVNYKPENYLPQLKYTSTIITDLADSILHILRNRDAVIIFQGDHGFKFMESDPAYDLESNDIMYAVYCSDQDYSQWPEKISSVNGFRILFNKYFDTKLPILPDSSYNLYYRQ